jgi:deoxyribodipyrimidine photo-lyase
MIKTEFMDSVVHVMWFRRDLRLYDNAALFYALKSGKPVLPVFIFDTQILNQLEDKSDRRVSFIYDALCKMQSQLASIGSTMEVINDSPINAFKYLLTKYTIEQVYTSEDYEGYAIERDTNIEQLLSNRGIAFHKYKDQVIFHKSDVLKDDGKPYTVYTPYSKKWKATLTDSDIKTFNCEPYFSSFLKQAVLPFPDLKSIGFKHCKEDLPSGEINQDLIRKYSDQRDIPGINGTSKLGVHLRFGTVSIRQIVGIAKQLNDTFLNELIWREFYQMIVFHFPYINKGLSFKQEYDKIVWVNNEADFKAWCMGKTGYPIVDAGMRELNATGFMHNRVRMITASFLVKHLLIDWRWGESYFASKLMDYDFAANNGGWQWAAGSGCDAAPYFRVFNPTLQTQKFDPELKYIRKWVPELDSLTYPAPIVDHTTARLRALATYKKALER